MQACHMEGGNVRSSRYYSLVSLFSVAHVRCVLLLGSCTAAAPLGSGHMEGFFASIWVGVSERIDERMAVRVLVSCG